MKKNFQKILISAVLLLWQSNVQAADMMQMMPGQEPQAPAIPASSPAPSSQPQAQAPAPAASMPPTAALGGTELSLTPATPSKQASAPEATPSPSTAPSKNNSTPAATTTEMPKDNSATPVNPPTEAKTAKDPGIIPEENLPPEIDEEYKVWMEDPMIKNLIDNVKYCKNKQDCDDFTQQLHVYLTMLGIESYQVTIIPTGPKPVTPGDPLPPLVLNPKPPEGHAVVVTVTEGGDGKLYMCMYEPQTGARYGCTEVPNGNMGERNELAHELATIWMEENYPKLNHTVTTTNTTTNVDPSDGRPPYLDPKTNIDLNTPEGRNIDNLRRCFYIMQQDGSTQLVCTEGN